MSDVEVLFLGLDITLVIFSALFGDFKKKNTHQNTYNEVLTLEVFIY